MPKRVSSANGRGAFRGREQQYSHPATSLVALAIAVTITSENASAQENDPGPDEVEDSQVNTETTSGSAEAEARLDVITVRARKREEVLSDVPISGTIVDSETLDIIGGVVDSEQITQFIAGAGANEEGTVFQEFFVRGAGGGRVPSTDSAVIQLRNGATVTGGLGGRTLKSFDFFDTEQVEFYRGSQGAFFGRSAVGGVLNLSNVQPRDSFEYSGLASYDFERDQLRLEGILNQPLTETLFFRGGFQLFEEDGLYQNLVPSLDINEPARERERWSARTSLRWLVNEYADATLTVDFEDSQFNTLAAERRATEPGAAVTFPVSGDPFILAQDTPGFLVNETFNVNLRTNVDLPFATLESITNFRRFIFNYEFDSDGSVIGNISPAGNGCRNPGGLPPPVFGPPGTAFTQCVTDMDSETEIFSQEVRLTGPSDRKLQWLAGMDYRSLENSILERDTGQRELPVFNFNTSSREEIDEWEFGAFVSADYQLPGNWRLAGAVRYSHSNKALATELRSLDTADAGAVLRTAQGEESFDELTPSVSLSYDTDDFLGFVAYSRGYRPGGFNRVEGNVPGGSTFPGEIVPFAYDEELADTIEVGAKGDWRYDTGGLSWSVVGYNVWYTDLLATTVGLQTGPDGFFDLAVFNVGDAWARGVEMDLRGRHRFSWGGSIGYQLGATFNDSEITDVTRENINPGREGLQLAELPSETFNSSMTYRQPIASTGLNFVGNFNYTIEVGRLQQTSNVPRDDIERSGARVGVEGETDFGLEWTLMAFVENVLDSRFNTSPSTCDFGALGSDMPCSQINDPRTFGIRMTFGGR